MKRITIDCPCGSTSANKIGPGVYSCAGCGMIYMTKEAKDRRWDSGLSIPQTPTIERSRDK